VPRRAHTRPEVPGDEKILDAGREVFGRRGFDAASTAEIAAAAGIAKSSLYHHFGSKAGLYRAIVEHDSQALLAAVAAAVPPPGEPGPRLRPGVDAFLRFLSEHPDTWNLMTCEPPDDPELRRLHQQIQQGVAFSLRGLLAMPEKLESKPDVVDLVALAVRTYAAWWQSHPDIPREEVVEAIGDLAASAARRIAGRAPSQEF
jgi:AcrR family transcriptional regulator